MDAANIQIIEQVLGWRGSAALSTVLASLAIVASLVWFAWICLAQLPRLRAGDITVQTMLAEDARAFVVVIATFATVYFLQVSKGGQ